jgi:hypothetical protein
MFGQPRPRGSYFSSEKLGHRILNTEFSLPKLFQRPQAAPEQMTPRRTSSWVWTGYSNCPGLYDTNLIRGGGRDQKDMAREKLKRPLSPL